MFSSDNGYHLGQHRLLKGKQTAFDTDIHVPLIVAGPGVPHHRVVDRPVEGHSPVPLLQPAMAVPSWRSVALVEHQKSNDASDPDFEGGGSNPTTYEAIRISAKHLSGFKGAVDAVYVEYKNPQHETEFYDIKKDPYEQRNVAAQLTAAQRTELHRILAGLETCHTAGACWSAASPK